MFWEKVSSIKYHTQNGPSENSSNINNVISDAYRNLDAKIKTKFIKPCNTDPHKMHKKISFIGTFKLPRFTKKVNVVNNIPETKHIGIISMWLYFLAIIMKQEKNIAQHKAKIFPRNSLLSMLSFNMINIPTNANIIIMKVLNEIFSLKKINAINAVIKGIALKVNNVFAIVVSEKDKINNKCAPIRKSPPKKPIFPIFLIFLKILNLYFRKRTNITVKTKPNDLKNDICHASA